MEVIKEINTDCKVSHSECIDVLQSNSDSDDGALANLFTSWEEDATNGENNNNNTTNANNDKSNAVELYPIETLMVDRKVMMSEGIGNDEPFDTLYTYFDGYCNVGKEYEQVLLSSELSESSLSSEKKNQRVIPNESDIHEQDASTLATVTTKYAFECALKRKVYAEWEATGTNVQMNVHYRNKRHSLWGHKLWNAAKYLAKRIDSGLIDVFNKRVLELGAGLGMPSLVSYLNGAKLTVITDYPDEELLEILRMNAEENCAINKLDKRALHKYAEMFAQKYFKSSITDKKQVFMTKASSEERDNISTDESKLESKLEETSANYNIDGDKNMFTPTLEEMLNSHIQCHVCPLLWGNEDHMAHVYSLTSSHPNDSESGFDCIFLSDILFNHVCNDDLVYTVAELLSKANKNAAAYCVFSHHRPHKQLQDYQFFDKCVAHGLHWTLLDVVEYSYPLMFAEDKGPEYVRQPVKCYKLTLATDLAGLPVELRSCIKYNHDEKEHLFKEGKYVMNNNHVSTDVTAESNAKKDDLKDADSKTTAKLKFARNKQKNGMIDVVINGTGPVQSFLSAALARSSCNVLHCDGSAHYGGAFWTLSLRDFHNYLTRHAELTKKENEGNVNTAAVRETASSRVMSCLDEQSPALCTSANVHINHMNTLCATEQTQFQIDFLPASYMAAGDTINYIIESNTTQYLEFQNYNRLCFLVPSQQITPTKKEKENTEVVRQSTTCTNHADPVISLPQQANTYSWNLHDAPLTRSAVFASSLLSLLDKRRLMKFVKDIADVLVEQHHAMHSNLSDDPNYHGHTTHIYHTNNTSTSTHKTEQNDTNDTNDKTILGNCNDNDNVIETVKELPEAVVQAIKGNYAITLPAFLQSHYKLSNDAVNILTLFGTANVMECVRNDCSEHHSKLAQLDVLHEHSSQGEVESEEERQEKYHKATESNNKSISVLTRQECKRICGAPLAQSIRFIRQLLFSVNRFGGSTPLLLPCYGSGEVIQAMCRNSAVYGSTFVLRRSVQGIAIPSLPSIGEAERMQFAVLSNGQHIPTKVIVTPIESASQIAVTLEEWKYILRAGKRLMRTGNTLRKATSNSNYNEDKDGNKCEEEKEKEDEEERQIQEEMIKLPLTLETVLEHCNSTQTNHAINNNTEKEHDTNAIHANTISTSINNNQQEVKENDKDRNDESETSTAFSPSSASPSSASPSSSSYLALTRLVVVTKTPLFCETGEQSHSSVNVNENKRQDSSDYYIDRYAPLVMTLVKIPEKVENLSGDNKQSNSGNGVIYLIQHTKTSEQAPASVTPSEGHTLASTSMTSNTNKEWEERNQHTPTLTTNYNNTDTNTTVHNHEEDASEQDKVHKNTYYGPSILHFMVDARCMSQEQLYNFAMDELLPSLYLRNKTIDGQHNVNEDSSNDSDEFRSWIIYCASFTISTESVAIAMQVRDPYSPPSETLKTDDYSILDNLKVERAIQHQRDRLLRTHTTQPSTSASRTSEHDEETRIRNNKCKAYNNNINNFRINDYNYHDSLINEALEQICENMCVFTVPSLLPNVLDDGAYMRRAKEIYKRIMHVLHISHPFLSSHANTENLN